MGIFNIDNKFFRALNKLVDMVILSFCWIISCIPVFTIGAASTACIRKKRIRKCIIHRSIRFRSTGKYCIRWYRLKRSPEEEIHGNLGA